MKKNYIRGTEFINQNLDKNLEFYYGLRAEVAGVRYSF